MSDAWSRNRLFPGLTADDSWLERVDERLGEGYGPRRGSGLRRTHHDPAFDRMCVLSVAIKYSGSGELSRGWFAEGLDLTPLPSRDAGIRFVVRPGRFRVLDGVVSVEHCLDLLCHRGEVAIAHEHRDVISWRVDDL